MVSHNMLGAGGIQYENVDINWNVKGDTFIIVYSV
jgi:hypothetical protein